MIPIFLGQLLIPVLIAAWFIGRPSQSAIGFLLQLTGSLLLLTALTRVGIWLFPPWWIPHAVAAAMVLRAFWLLRSRPWRTIYPRGILGWLNTALFVAIGAFSTILLARAVLASRIPAEPGVVALAFPLQSGRYMVVNGGSAVMLNAHRESMDTSVARLQPWRGNGHAVDIVRIDAFGFRASGVQPRDPAAYHIFGNVVVAPCAGTVVAAVDGLEDMPVPDYDRENMAGNHAILECGEAHIVLAHFRRGSLTVAPGQTVRTGDRIATVGNSGGTNEPHLHIHAQLPGPASAPMSGDPLPILLAGRFLVRGDRITIRSPAP